MPREISTRAMEQAISDNSELNDPDLSRHSYQQLVRARWIPRAMRDDDFDFVGFGDMEDDGIFSRGVPRQ